MPIIQQTDHYRRWFAKLKDENAKARIDARLARLVVGNPGDVRFVGHGVQELKIDYGPGYRIYFIRKAGAIVFLLAGGDKRTQDKDIAKAIELARLDKGFPQ